MKPILVREQRILNSSINFDKTEYNYFHNPLHYHPEFELTLILKSYGQRRIGDHIENFSEGDLVLVGTNLPHVWKNDDIFLSDNTNLKAQAIAVKFLPDFAGKDFMDRPEIVCINKLLMEKSPYGLKLVSNLRDEVKKIMLQMPDMDEADKFMNLLLILHLISKSNEYELLASLNYRNEKTKNTHRVSLALDFIMNNYQENLTLELVASKFNISKNAFCRLFKKGTRKNLFTVINEVRIGKACQYLNESDMNILQICYACGYNNVSTFNKAFKKIHGISPTKYKKGQQFFNQAEVSI